KSEVAPFFQNARVADRADKELAVGGSADRRTRLRGKAGPKAELVVRAEAIAGLSRREGSQKKSCEHQKERWPESHPHTLQTGIRRGKKNYQASTSQAANCGVEVSACLSLELVTRATAATIITIPAPIYQSRRSPAINHPRKTATTGFTYAYVATLGVGTCSSSQ